MGQAMLKKCPVCRKPATQKDYPFCCARCAQIDLGRWLGGKYAVPTEEKPSEVEGEGEPKDP